MTHKYCVEASEELKQGAFYFPIDGNYCYIKTGASTVGQLKKAGILPDKDYRGLLKNKPDGLIVSGKDEVRVLIEYKKDGVFSSEKEAKEALRGKDNFWYYKLATELGCKALCVSDGVNTYWFHAKTGNTIIDENNEVLRKVFNASDFTEGRLAYEERQEWLKLFNAFDDVDDNAKLKKKVVLNPQNLANRVWQKIWINTGKEPEKCLYNVVELFIFKFLSDLNILHGYMGFDHIYDVSKENKNQALSFYANNIRGVIKYDMFPAGEDGTTIFNGTIFVNENGQPNLSQAGLFAQVLEEFAKYDKEYGSFKNIDKQFKTRLYESFLRQSAGVATLGQYFTPRNVVISIINMINPDSIAKDAKICDPFCGVGGFLLELINQFPKLKKQFIPINGKVSPDVEIIGYDKGSDEKDDERTIILAKANMLIYLSDLLAEYTNCMTEFSNNAFNKVFHLVKTNLGTLGITKHKNYFDLIVTNPPYVTSGVSSIKKEINDNNLKYLYPSNGNGMEGLAIEWIINALKPDGVAYIVLPDGLMSRQSDKKLRDKIIDTCYINAIVSLPSRTFFATPKKTYILVIKKKTKPIVQNTPVFGYIISEVGETRDAKRLEIKENNLLDMSRLYRQFSAVPNDFVSNDKRCKIYNISRLSNEHWLIDRDWTDDEKLDLGIFEETSEISENDFYDLLGEIGNFITTMSKKEG